MDRDYCDENASGIPLTSGLPLLSVQSANLPPRVHMTHARQVATVLLFHLAAARSALRGGLPFTWIIGADWDDTLKAGGNDRFFGIRGVGRRVRGTYPGVTTLMAELDECGTVDVQFDQRCFQVWSANPFSNKKQSSCVPPLHRKPLTRKGSLLAGLGWVLANQLPGWPSPAVRRWCLEASAKSLGTAKVRAFRRAATEAGPSEILFFGDSAQGDVSAALRMLSDKEHGAKAWVFIHDLTREVAPGGRAPKFEDARIAVRNPFRGDHRDAWRDPRLHFYKTYPEAAFLLAQQGFLGRRSLQRIVDATRRELDREDSFRRDERVLERLRRQGRASVEYRTLIEEDARKCEALIACERFWTDGTFRGPADAREWRALATEEILDKEGVASSVRCTAPSAPSRAVQGTDRAAASRLPRLSTWLSAGAQRGHSRQSAPPPHRLLEKRQKKDSKPRFT
jgi:hypothetical protein